MSTQPEIDTNQQEELDAFADDGENPTPEVAASQPIEESTPEPAPEVQPDPTPEPAPEPTPPAPEPTVEQKALHDLAQKMERVMMGMDKAHGNYGELKRELQELKKAAATPQAAAAHALSEDAFAELDVFEMPDLKNGIKKGVAAEIEQRLANLNQGLQPEQLAQHHATLRDQEIQAEIEEANKLLDAHYPERFDTVASPEWKQWEASLNPVAVNKFYTTRDPEYVALRLEEFKGWKAAQDSKKNTQSRRLDAAIAPRGDKTAIPPVQNERDAMLAAFNSNDP